MEVFVLCNQKGGVGKSTFSIHMAHYYAQRGARVLFADFDGQANSTASLRSRSYPVGDTFGLFGRRQMEVVDGCPDGPGIGLLQGNLALNDVERMPDDCIKRPRRQLQRFAAKYDYCIIDTPPTLGLRLISALVAANYALCPFELAGYSIQGLTQIVTTINGCREKFNADLVFLGMIINRLNSRSISHREALKTVLKEFSSLIITPPMTNRVSVQDATDQGKPVWEIRTGAARIAAQEIRAVLHKIDQLVQEKANVQQPPRS